MRDFFFYSSICNFCKQMGDLKKCSSCKICSYCSRQHQELDWKNHKVLCKIIAQSNQSLQYNVRTFSELSNFQIKQSLFWQTRLGRPLKPDESQMWMFPQVCAVCFTRANLRPCEICFNAFYCSEEHKRKHTPLHNQFCKLLYLAMQVDTYCFSGGTPNKIRFKGPVGVQSLPKTADDFVKDLTDINFVNERQYILDCDEIMCGATILYGLEQSLKLYNMKLLMDSISIHFIGASNFELHLNWLYIFELLLHWLENLKEIRIFLFGPDMKNANFDFMIFQQLVCNFCQTKIKCLTMETFTGLYHERIRDCNRPNIVIAFNSGLHEFEGSENDLWQSTLQSIKCWEAPLLLTAYTEDEIVKDLEKLKNYFPMEVLCEPKVNPFANKRPLRNWDRQNVPIFFVNGYVTIVKEKSVN
ncbi:uncharacterized protein LOC132696410 [Cylas formicarius]|uniref:uncharacterized protein LOC132696410 n=1 Tax=Cylas formicarius TaxID=197179 RepID=UPI002958C788|nr:uncharacterized protein LOC132696410 [Cylas formicarius]